MSPLIHYYHEVSYMTYMTKKTCTGYTPSACPCLPKQLGKFVLDVYRVRLNCHPRIGQFCSSSCLPLLPQLASSILTTWECHLSRAMYALAWASLLYLIFRHPFMPSLSDISLSSNSGFGINLGQKCYPKVQTDGLTTDDSTQTIKDSLPLQC